MKSVQIRSFSGPYFPVFGLNIKSEYREIQTRKNSVFGHFSRIVYNADLKYLHNWNQKVFFLKKENGVVLSSLYCYTKVRESSSLALGFIYQFRVLYLRHFWGAFWSTLRKCLNKKNGLKLLALLFSWQCRSYKTFFIFSVL